LKLNPTIVGLGTGLLPTPLLFLPDEALGNCLLGLYWVVVCLIAVVGHAYWPFGQWIVENVLTREIKFRREGPRDCNRG
jgi:hypothetical protein